jgi:subtilisin family serine protease
MSVSRRIAAALMALGFVLAPAPLAGAAPKKPPGVPKGAPKPKFPQQRTPTPEEKLAPTPAAETTDAEWDRLAAKAERAGTVRVIVSLATTAKPEGDLTAAQRSAQRARIDEKADAVLETLEDSKVDRVKDFEVIPFMAMRVDAEGLEELRASADVTAVSEDRQVSADEGALQGRSDNASLAQWWDLGRTSTQTAWNNGYDGRGKTVAVIDTGVQSNHSWLSGKIVAEGCYLSNSRCPNGYWSQTGAGAAAPCTFDTLCSHGTHVASTAAGIYGVARSASIMPIQVFYEHPYDGTPTYAESDLLWAMKHVYDRRNSYSIASVNLSLGDHQGWMGACDDRASSSSFYAWANALRSVGIATVVASGNDGYYNGMNAPACNSNVISVGNTTLDWYGNDSVNFSSNASAGLTLLAPGTSICGAVTGNGSNCGYTGTSMAAPHVAGAIASLKQLRPGATVTSEITALQQSGVGVYDDWAGITRSRINVWNAVVYLYNH